MVMVMLGAAAIPAIKGKGWKQKGIRYSIMPLNLSPQIQNYCEICTMAEYTFCPSEHHKINLLPVWKVGLNQILNMVNLSYRSLLL
jgi:hypothetical protein